MGTAFVAARELGWKRSLGHLGEHHANRRFHPDDVRRDRSDDEEGHARAGKGDCGQTHQGGQVEPDVVQAGRLGERVEWHQQAHGDGAEDVRRSDQDGAGENRARKVALGILGFADIRSCDLRARDGEQQPRKGREVLEVECRCHRTHREGRG